MDLGYRLLAVCAANRDKFTPKSAGKAGVFFVSGHLASRFCVSWFFFPSQDGFMIPVQYIPQGFCALLAKSCYLARRKWSANKNEKPVINPEDKDRVVIDGFTPDVWNSEERRGRAVARVVFCPLGLSSLS